MSAMHEEVYNKLPEAIELMQNIIRRGNSIDDIVKNYPMELLRHTLSVAKKTERLARFYGEDTGRPFTEHQLKAIYHGGLFHDLGKLMVPYGIIDKPGKLCFEEFEIIKTHPRYGYELFRVDKSAIELSENDPETYEMIRGIILYHHEKMNGKGYTGLVGDEIPLAARICAVADVYDALCEVRPYRDALDDECALRIMNTDEGHFDMNVLGVFESHMAAITAD